MNFKGNSSSNLNYICPDKSQVKVELIYRLWEPKENKSKDPSYIEIETTKNLDGLLVSNKENGFRQKFKNFQPYITN